MFRELALAGVMCVAAITSVQASTVTGSFSGTIDAPTDVSNSSIRYIGAGTDLLEWGTLGANKKKVVSGNSSSLSVNAVDFSFDQEDLNGGSVLLGTITWNNQSNFNAGGNWSSQINLNIDFSSGSDVSLSQSVGFDIANTTDSSFNLNKNERTGSNPDLINGISLDANAFGVPVSLGGGKTLTSIFFGAVDLGKGSTYDAATGLWSTVEGGTSTIGIYGEISTVPLPAGLWFMIAGLGSFAAVRGRKKTA